MLYMSPSLPVPCTALHPPRYGYYYVDRGSGVSLGSVLVYWCQEGYQLVGSERIACLRQESTSSWSHPPPQCQGKEPSGGTQPLSPLPGAQGAVGSANPGGEVQPPALARGLPRSDQASEGSRRQGGPATLNRNNESPD